MQHLALIGGGERLLYLAGQLRQSGFAITLLPEQFQEGGPHRLADMPSPPRLALVESSQAEEFEGLAPTADGHALPWLFLCGGPAQVSEGELTTAAYRAGALAVLPAASSTDLVVQAVQRAIGSLVPARGADTPGKHRRAIRAGDTIPLRIDEMLRVIEGVVAQVAWHADGAEGLVGLWGPGHLLPGHPEDSCSLSLRAHTEVLVEISPLAPDGDAFERLLERSRQLEAWATVQSRQSMEQRLLGLLALLAEQFGEPCPEGTWIDVRVTHAQMAAAIGATRATVTRLLGTLRRRGLISTVSTLRGERFCLPRPQTANYDTESNYDENRFALAEM